MSLTSKIIIVALLSIPGVIISYILFFILGGILIPDECYYHSNDPNWFINLMYDFPGWNGFHPYPSNFQFGLILLLGIYLAYLFSKKALKYNA
jgi:hypothetical protein